MKNAPLSATKAPGRTPNTGAISTFTGSWFMKPKKQPDFILKKDTHSTKNAPLPETKSPGRTPNTGAISTFTGS